MPAKGKTAKSAATDNAIRGLKSRKMALRFHGTKQKGG
jgi:hypothetical protein